ncbi:hypothetical protein VU07_05415 [Desulfobulbus sp. F4]|nr:hypothetical protein [Desulfobulbus sp. F4]
MACAEFKRTSIAAFTDWTWRAALICGQAGDAFWVYVNSRTVRNQGMGLGGAAVAGQMAKKFPIILAWMWMVIPMQMC